MDEHGADESSPPPESEDPEQRPPRPPGRGTVPTPRPPLVARRPAGRRALEPPSIVRSGSRVGSRRVVLPRGRGLLRIIAPGHWRATPAAESVARGPLDRIRRALIGAPLSSAAEAEERLDKKRALPVFASDALSSTAYATEEILLVLVLAGTAFLDLALPIALGIAALLVVVTLSYRQTVHAYPMGGGAYTVASENLGSGPALVAGASLLTDYVLTVAVSISAGALAIVSALPALLGFEVEIALVGVVAITAVNLRGVRESGSILGVLTYCFVGAFALMLVVGLTRLALGGMDGATLTTSRPPAEAIVPVTGVGLLLVLRAFSSGATALTGVEAVANGVRAFKPPESRNAATTLLLMAVILGSFFAGATFLAVRLGVVPAEDDSVISQVARTVFDGAAPLYYAVQATTAMVLVLAANTAFNGFPRLAAILARDGYMPRRFNFLDDRLTYSAGILSLAVVSAALLVLFRADTHRLIPLYAVGVFLSFTISQAGMVVHWVKQGGVDRRAMAINTIGAIATGVVAIVVAGTKFTHGAWMVLVLIPLLVAMLRAVRGHYRQTYGSVALRASDGPGERPRRARRADTAGHMPMLIPVRRVDKVVAFAVDYARAMSDNVTAVHIRREGEAPAAEFVARWERLFPDVPMVVVESPYRTFMGPFLSYVDSVLPADGSVLTIVVPALETDHWWERILHNSTARLIAAAASKRPRVIVTAASARPGVLP